jgi:hypothetical protein
MTDFSKARLEVVSHGPNKSYVRPASSNDPIGSSVNTNIGPLHPSIFVIPVNTRPQWIQLVSDQDLVLLTQAISLLRREADESSDWVAMNAAERLEEDLFEADRARILAARRVALAADDRTLVWESSDHDDEPRDQNADTRIVPHGYWSLGPDGDELWTAVLVVQDESLDVIEERTYGPYATEALAKAEAQRIENTAVSVVA